MHQAPLAGELRSNAAGAACAVRGESKRHSHIEAEANLTCRVLVFIAFLTVWSLELAHPGL
jgi:hypothetical protein